MKTIIAGGRDFNDTNLFNLAIKTLPITEVISGCARGADTLAIDWANKNNIPLIKYPADWNTYGKSAGYIRNIEMLKNAEQLLAFWDGYSKGTEHMIKQATKKGLRIAVIAY